MSSVLVTGGTGFIGSHTCVALLEAGYNIIILDNLSNSHKEIVNKIEAITNSYVTLCIGDVGDKEFLEKVFSEHDIGGVIHFAALKSVGDSCKKPFSYYKNNISGTLHLLELMHKHDVKKMIFSSSATVYDASSCEAPFVEEDYTGSTTNPYGTTKFVMEQIIRDLCAWKGLECIALRYFNPIGAHISGLLGEDPTQIPTNLLPVILQVLQGDREYLEIFGDDYDTPDGTCIRDYIHVMDVADAHVSAYAYLQQDHSRGDKSLFVPINIGTGKGTSVYELLSAVKKASEKNIPYMISPRRNGDVALVTANVGLAQSLLEWESKYSIEEAVQHALRFIEGV